MRLKTLLPFVGSLSLALSVNADELKVGDVAPKFKLKGSDDKEYALEDFKDKQVVVMAWFPKAFTGG